MLNWSFDDPACRQHAKEDAMKKPQPFSTRSSVSNATSLPARGRRAKIIRDKARSKFTSSRRQFPCCDAKAYMIRRPGARKMSGW